MPDIILIEDDDFLREYLREGLVEAGHAVRDAAGGHAGLALYRERPADVVITDLFMDHGEGMETVMALRDSHPTPLVIAISGNPLYLEQSLKLGAARAMLKPFTMAAILDAVTQPLRRSG